MNRQGSRRGRRPTPRGTAKGRIRIIAGEWRGRQLPVHDGDGLRPTGDRMRETLFNWLTPFVFRAHCLDLFAGSGALGLEALSRGAACCDFVDASPPLARSLAEVLQQLGAQNRATVHGGDALAFLRGAESAWDIVFVDPPFSEKLATPALSALIEGGLLAPGGLVYLENSRASQPVIPSGLTLRRHKSSGAVEARLLEMSDAGTEPT